MRRFTWRHSFLWLHFSVLVAGRSWSHCSLSLSMVALAFRFALSESLFTVSCLVRLSFCMHGARTKRSLPPELSNCLEVSAAKIL
jgi:hypothetical protein